jgi:hypothetical protein
MSEVTAAIARDGSASQRASQWRRASAIGSMRSGGLTVPKRMAPRADFSFWPGHKEVWTVTEHAGRRVLYAVSG